MMQEDFMQTSSMQEIEIRVKNLKKYFKEVKAVDDISFEV